MDQIAEQIMLFHRLYVTCFWGTGIFLLFAAVIFFQCDMKSVLSYFARQKKTVFKTEKKTEDFREISDSFCVVKEIMYVHSQEIIEWEEG